MTATTYDQFWLQYLRAHSSPSTRALHYAGTLCAIGGALLALAVERWWVAGAGLVLGYLLAWTGHFALQENRPVALHGPKAWAYSFISDLRMFGLGLTGRLGPELKRAGVAHG